MTREEAIRLVKENVKTKNLRKHMYAAEACMSALAERLGGDTDEWALAGLLHDLDYDQTVDDFPKHGFVTEEMLGGLDVSPEVINGLIVAAALMHPTKKLANVDVGFIMKRFKEKRFAAGANREQIRKCEALGLELEEFVGVCLSGMQGISGELGL